MFVSTFKSSSDNSEKHFSYQSMVTIMHDQNIIYYKTHLDGTTHEKSVIFRQLFAGHMVGFRPMKRNKKVSNDNRY